MRTLFRISTLLSVFILLASCSSPGPTVTNAPRDSATPLVHPSLTVTPSLEATATATVTPSSTPLAPTLTPSPVEPTATSTFRLPPESILRYQPLEITPDLPSDVKPTGALLVWGKPPQLLHFDPQVWLEDLPAIGTYCLLTSPDGNWLAYNRFSDDSPTGQWLIVESADQQQEKRVPMDTGVQSFCATWLDNQRLIYPLIRKEWEMRPMVVINPFTGEQLELSSDYPDIQPDPGGFTGSLQFGNSDVVYDPTLDLVVYPQWGPQSYLVVWNRQTQTVVAKVKDLGPMEHVPKWSSDGKQLAVAVTYRTEKQLDHFIEEWFSVSRDGHVERLTHFGDYFVNARIGTANWSPDGQKLAFWLETSPSLCPGVNLAILEMATRQVTNTCVPTLGYDGWTPLWSLDSRYIAVANTEVSPYQTILVDFEQGRAFNLPYGSPIGWLALP
jgi:hypothetical protein